MPRSRPGGLTLRNWDLGGPISAWSYAHADQLFVTELLRAGRSSDPLIVDPRPVPSAVAHALQSDLVGSAVVLLNGRAAFRTGPTARHPRLLMSVSKVVASVMIGILADRGDLAYDESIRTALPDLGRQWEPCRLIDVLDMASGVACPEVGDPGAYLDPDHPFFRFEASLGWRPAVGVDSPFDLVLEYARLGEPGAEFAYTSVNTFLLAWAVETVTGLRYLDAVRQLLWGQMALAGDAAWAVNDAGIAVAHGGLIMSTEDLARFGTVFTGAGHALGHRLQAPTSYSDMLQRPRAFAAPSAPFVPAGAWPAAQWNWVDHDGDMFKSGFGGQGLFVSPQRDIVIAFTGTPDADGTTNGVGALCRTWADALA